MTRKICKWLDRPRDYEEDGITYSFGINEFVLSSGLKAYVPFTYRIMKDGANEFIDYYEEDDYDYDDDTIPDDESEEQRLKDEAELDKLMTEFARFITGYYGTVEYLPSVY